MNVPPDNEGQSVREPDGGTVEAILDDLEKWTEDERKRSDAFSQRAAWLLAFCGVILGLAAQQAREVLLRSDELGSLGRVVASVSLWLAAFCVVAAAGWSLSVLFAARKGVVVIDDDEIEKALAGDRLTDTKAQAQLRTAQILQLQIPDMRKQNAARARLLIRAFVALLIAVVLLVAHISVFLADSLNGQECASARVAIPGQAAHRSSFIFADGNDTDDQPPVRIPPCPKTTRVPGQVSG